MKIRARGVLLHGLLLLVILGNPVPENSRTRDQSL